MAAPTASGENSPTLTMGMTQAGMILGTASYMAPEQARGKENVDKRADIWAFGVVLYELLTGKPMFTGEDVGEILAKVIRDEPDLRGAPPQVQRLLRACLEKEPKSRLRDAGDAFRLLEAPPQETPRQETPPASMRSALLPWVAVAAAMLAIVSAGASWIAYRATRPQGKSALQQASSAAVTTLMKIMVDPTAPAASRVRAADCILDRGAKALELEDMEARISVLERTAEVSKS